MCAKRRRWGSIETVVPGEVYRIRWPNGHKPSGDRDRPGQMVYGTWNDAAIELERIHIALTGVVDSDITYDMYWRAVVWPSCEGLESKTKSGYERVYVKELSPQIGADRVCDTTYRRASAVLGGIEAPSVQRAAHALWKKMCNMAIHDKLLQANPIDRTIPLKPKNEREKGTVEASDVFGLLSALGTSRYWRMVLLECVGGFRHEEAMPVCGFDISEYRDPRTRGRYACVAIERALVSVDGRKELKGPKTERSRRLQLFAEPFASMLLSLQGEGPLFPGRRPEGDDPNETWFANPTHITRNWRKWCERNGWEYIRPADMRTVYSDWHAEAESLDSIVQLSMGHDDGSTRGRNYQRLSLKVLAMIADNLAEYLISAAPCSDLLSFSEPRTQIGPWMKDKSPARGRLFMPAALGS